MKTLKKSAPKFLEANLDVCEVQVGGQWTSYALIKDAADMSAAIARVNADAKFRIVRCQMGRTVIYPA